MSEQRYPAPDLTASAVGASPVPSAQATIVTELHALRDQIDRLPTLRDISAEIGDRLGGIEPPVAEGSIPPGGIQAEAPDHVVGTLTYLTANLRRHINSLEHQLGRMKGAIS